MEKINLKKREKLITSLKSGAAAFLFIVTFSQVNLYKSNESGKIKIKYNEEGEIIDIKKV